MQTSQSPRHILKIRIPQTDKEDLREKVLAYRQEPHVIFSRFFEQLMSNFWEIFRGKIFSLEIRSTAQHIIFYAFVQEEYFQLLRGQIYAMYPTCEIETVEDYMETFDKENNNILATEMGIEKFDIYPIRNFETFKKDSLAGVLSVLSKAEKGEEAWIQLIVKPQPDDGIFNFRQRLKRWVNKFINLFRFRFYFKQSGFSKVVEDQNILINEKNDRRNFRCCLRAAYSVPKESPLKAYDKLNVLCNAMHQWNTMDEQLFVAKIPHTNGGQKRVLQKMKKREFGRSYMMTDQEVATMYHFPNEEEVPNIVHVMSKKSDPPDTLPTDKKDSTISFFGTTNFHNQNFDFGIKKEDRRRHQYVVGKSGSGKSKLLELLIKNDMEKGRGLCVLDPHGDLVDSVLRHVPEHRLDDVVIIDPSDTEFPVAFNLLEDVPADMRMRVTIGILDIFKKLFGTNWTDRLEHVLRYTVLALLSSPNTTVLSILKMLSDKNYRQDIVKNIQDDVVKNFWVNEFAGWSEKFDAEAITPLLNKVGQFVATNMIRNIVGQPRNPFNIRDIMDKEKILLIKLSKGILGEENAQLLGAMMITKIYQSAMSRADTREEERKDFSLYVDEFQNFATETFGEILSEARKYRLQLILAHQFLGQLEDKIRKTVFGNVGSLISFRVGAEDARILEQEFHPIFRERDFVNLGVQELYIKMLIDGQSKDAFSARSLNVTYPKDDFAADIIKKSRTKYALPKVEVEKILQQWNESGGQGDFRRKPFEQVEFEEPLL